MKDVYIVQCLMETDLYKLLKTQVRTDIVYACLGETYLKQPFRTATLKLQLEATNSFSFPGY